MTSITVVNRTGTQVRVEGRVVRVTVDKAGVPGPQGIPGPPGPASGVNENDLPDFRLIFENQLL